MPLGAYRRLSC